MCGDLRAYDPATGTRRWYADSLGAFAATPAVDAAGTIYVASQGQEGGFYGFHTNGTEKWRYLIADAPDETIAVAGGIPIGAEGTLYGGFGRRVYAFWPDPS